MSDFAGLVLPQAVIFDMDGLMVNSEPVWGKAWEIALSRQGLELKPGFQKALAGAARPRALEITKEFYGPTEAAITAFDEHYDEVRRLFIDAGAPKMPGLDELLALLAKWGIPMAVASSTARPSVDAVLAHAGIAHYFDAIQTGDMGYPSKPAPDIFLAAADALDVRPETAWVLEDSPAGIRAAITGGFVPLMVPNLAQPDAELREHAIVLDSLLKVRDLLMTLN